MKRIHRKNKWLRIILFSAITIIVILIIGGIVLQSVLPGKIRQKLTMLGPEIHVTVGSIDASLLYRSLVLNDLSVVFRPDTSKSHTHYIHLTKVSISGINFLSLAFSNKANIGSILLEKGDAELDRYLIENKQEEQLAILTSKNISLPNLNIGRLEIVDMNLKVMNNKVKQLSLQANIVVKDIRPGTYKLSPIPGGLGSDDISGTLTSISSIIPGQPYDLYLHKITFDTKSSSLEMDSLKVIPWYGKLEFGEKLGHQVDHVDASITNIKCNNIDLLSLPGKKLVADKISINGVHAYVFRDRRLPRTQLERPMPVASLEDVPVTLRVKTLSINNTFVTYEEFPKDGKQTGILKIEKFNGTLSPLINHYKAHDHGYMEMHSEASIMGSGTVTANMRMPLDSNKDYQADGSINNLDLTTLNSSAENLGGFRIESGILNSLSFHFDLSNEKSTGKIVGEYHNLIADKLKKNSDKIDRLKTFALQKIIIPKNKDKSLAVSKRTGIVDYTRDPTRYPSYYLLKSLLKGIKSSFKFGFLLPG